MIIRAAARFAGHDGTFDGAKGTDAQVCAREVKPVRVNGKQLSMPLHSDVAHQMESGNSRCASSGLEHCATMLAVTGGLRSSSCTQCAPYG